MMNRSLRTDVRNPLIRLSGAQAIQQLSPEAKKALDELLTDIVIDARIQAEKCWRKHKAPMAAYWKAVSVYAGHTRKLTRLQMP